MIERADLGAFLATRTDKLSGGQAQRLRYALAIMPDPDLLILDEPTVAMDVEVRRAFWASMRDFVAGGRTVLFATHYLDEADAEAIRIVVLAEGARRPSRARRPRRGHPSARSPARRSSRSRS